MPTCSEHEAKRPVVLLLSGTHEGPPLAHALIDAGLHVCVKVTRPEARGELFGPLLAHPACEVHVCSFDVETLTVFLKGRGAHLVLDATHPYAVRITKIAQRACQESGVPLIRYERPPVTHDSPKIHVTPSFAEAAERLPDIAERAMLVIGSKPLKHFAKLHKRLTLFGRILPHVASLQQALEAGFTSSQLLCLRPPFSEAFNEAMFRAYEVDTLVTKDSGQGSGLLERLEAAEQLGLNVLMVRRPAMASETAVTTTAEAVQRCRDILEVRP